MNNFCAFIADWLNGFQRNWDCNWINRFTREWSVKCFEKSQWTDTTADKDKLLWEWFSRVAITTQKQCCNPLSSQMFFYSTQWTGAVSCEHNCSGHKGIQALAPVHWEATFYKWPAKPWAVLLTGQQTWTISRQDSLIKADRPQAKVFRWNLLLQADHVS